MASSIATVTILLISACSSSPSDDTAGTTNTSTPASARASENKIILAALQDPGTLDIVTQNQTALVLWLPGNVYETLVINQPDGTVAPGVAESWTISDDQLTYIFKIRDAKFSNGDPITAADVVYSLTTMQNGPIGGYHGPFTQVKSIVATDAKTVTVTLKQSSRSFFKGMGEMSGVVQPKSNENNRATAPIGSGPYVLTEYVPNDHLTFDLNANYWGPTPKMQQVTVKIMTDGNAALAALRAGEIDGFPVITIDLWERIGKEGYNKDFKQVNFPQAGEMLYTLFNDTKAPYNDPKLRHAMAKMIDRKSFIAAYGAPAGSADATCGYGLQNTSWFALESADSCVDAFDPTAGKAELAAAGYTGKELEYVSLTDVPDLSLPADLQIGQFTDAGATIKRKAIALAEYSTTIFAARPPQFGVSIMSDPALLTQFSCESKAKAGWTTYCSKALTDLLVKADGAKTQEEFDGFMKQADDVLKNDAVIIPILAKAGVGLWHPDVKGWKEPRIFIEMNFADWSW